MCWAIGKKALRRGHGQKRHQESLAKMACYDGNKDQGSCKEREVLKPFGLEASSVARFWALFLVPRGSHGPCHARATRRGTELLVFCLRTVGERLQKAQEMAVT